MSGPRVLLLAVMGNWMFQNLVPSLRRLCSRVYAYPFGNFMSNWDQPGWLSLRPRLMDRFLSDARGLAAGDGRAIEPTTARQVVTCAVIELDLSSGEVRYINAGGPPPLLLVGQKRLITLDQPALVLGVDANYAYETATADLPSPFRMICHTDGVLETANAAGEGFGTDRLHELLLDPTAFAAPAYIIARIQSALEKHRSAAPPTDDALLAVIGHG